MILQKISLKVEAHLGANIEDVAPELVSLASHLRMTVETTFNDIICIAYPDTDPTVLIENFNVAITKDKQWASSRKGI